jgi:hypothetical protein
MASQCSSSHYLQIAISFVGIAHIINFKNKVVLTFVFNLHFETFNEKICLSHKYLTHKKCKVMTEISACMGAHTSEFGRDHAIHLDSAVRPMGRVASTTPMVF